MPPNVDETPAQCFSAPSFMYTVESCTTYWINPEVHPLFVRNSFACVQKAPVEFILTACVVIELL
jgi:hypothetical protein